MVKTPPKKTVIQPFYMVAVRECLGRGDRAEIQALLQGVKEVKAKYGDLSGLITELEGAYARCK